VRLAVAALAALSLSAGNTAAAALHNPWTEVTAPAAGPVHIIGSYAGGCIQGAQSILPDEGTYAIMRKSRRRYYAHPELRAVLKRIAREVLRRGWGKLLVGDIGQPRGGPPPGVTPATRSGWTWTSGTGWTPRRCTAA
jgi:penicillin-insensitive murein endopeptidase